MQVLVVGPGSMLGTSAIVKITSVGRWSVFGEVTETLNNISNDDIRSSTERNCGDKISLCSDLDKLCECSEEPEPCACGLNGCKEQTIKETSRNRNLIGWLLRRRKNHSLKRIDDGIVLEESKGKQGEFQSNMCQWSPVDAALLSGMTVSLLTIVALLFYLGYKNSSSE